MYLELRDFKVEARKARNMFSNEEGNGQDNTLCTTRSHPGFELHWYERRYRTFLNVERD